MRQLRDEVRGLRFKDVVSSDSAEMNSTYLDNDDRTPSDDVPVDDPLLMESELNSERVQVLTDDGFNTNGILFDLVRNYRELFPMLNNFVTVGHS